MVRPLPPLCPLPARCYQMLLLGACCSAVTVDVLTGCIVSAESKQRLSDWLGLVANSHRCTRRTQAPHAICCSFLASFLQQRTDQ
jgi:hypothetical protein